jgi:GNAT superfamily N-acetyltransferase
MTGERGDINLRRYTSEDRAEFLELYRSVFGNEGRREWFEWKYRENPYTDRVPIIVAEADGTLIGACPNFVLKLRVGDTVFTAVQPCDVMVHPDYRGMGIFSSLLSRSMEVHQREGVELGFTFPNEQSLPAFIPEWEPIDHPSVCYRLLPEAAVKYIPEIARAPLARVLDGITRRGGRSTDQSDVTVQRTTEVPSRTLSEIYHRHVPKRIHSVRDEEFHRWRFDRPGTEYVFHVAWSDGDPISALVKATVGDGVSHLVESLPLQHLSDEVIAKLLRSCLQDRGGSRSIAVFEPDVPASVLNSFGFYGIDQFPFEYIASSRSLIVNKLGSHAGGDWKIGGQDVRNPASWRLSYIDHDTQ